MSDPRHDPIAALQQRFRASFPEKREALLAALVGWQAAPHSISAIGALYLLTHKLAGSAGAYGFDALGNAARQADRLLQAPAHGDLVMTAEQIAAVAAAVLQLCDLLAAA